MTEQQGLFENKKYQPHSATSKAAAKGVQSKNETLRSKVYRFIEVSGRYGATDDEIQDFLGLEGSTERPRRVELVEQGKVKDGGKTRATRSGRKATVWVVA